MDADFSDIIANVGDGFSVGAQSVVADGDIAFVFDVDDTAGWSPPAFGFAGVPLAEIAFPDIHYMFVGVAQYVEEPTFYAAVDAGEVEEIGDGVLAKIIADIVPERMAGEGGICFGEAVETGEILIQYSIAELIVETGVPAFTGVSHETLFEPVGQIQENGILDNFLEVGAKEHGIQEYGGDAFPNLPAKVGMIPVEVNKNFIADNFCLSTGIGESFFASGVTLLEVGQVNIDNQLKFVVDAVFHEGLNSLVLLFGNLNGRLPDKAPIAIPVRDEMITFVFAPLVKIVMILHAIFTKLYLCPLSLEYAEIAGDGVDESGESEDAHGNKYFDNCPKIVILPGKAD